MTQETLPRVGDLLQDGSHGDIFRVADVFPAGQHAGMILEWRGYNPSKDAVGLRAQAFTTRDWMKRWRKYAA